MNQAFGLTLPMMPQKFGMICLMMSNVPHPYTVLGRDIESIPLLQSISTVDTPQLYGALCDADQAMDKVF